MKRLMKSRPCAASVEAYACVCMSATCSCACNRCGRGCITDYVLFESDRAKAHINVISSFTISSDHRHGLTDNMRL